MMKSITWLLALVAVLVVTAHGLPLNLGVARLDEINGISSPEVLVPQLSSELVSAGNIDGETIDASLPEGFSLAASSGIHLESATSFSVESQSELLVQSTQSGRLVSSSESLSASTVVTDFQSIDSSVVRSDSSISFNNPSGETFVASFLATTIEGEDSVSITSLYGDITATSDSTLFRSQLINVHTGDSIDDEGAIISAGRNLHADISGEFSVDTATTLTVTAERSVEITADDAFMNIEASDSLSMESTTSALDFIVQQDLAIQTILGSIDIESNNVINFNAFTVEFTSAEGIDVTSEGSIELVSNGGISFSDTNSTAIQTNVTVLSATHTINLETPNVLAVFSDQFLVTSENFGIELFTDHDMGTIQWDTEELLANTNQTFFLESDQLTILSSTADIVARVVTFQGGEPNRDPATHIESQDIFSVESFHFSAEADLLMSASSISFEQGQFFSISNNTTIDVAKLISIETAAITFDSPSISYSILEEDNHLQWNTSKYIQTSGETTVTVSDLLLKSSEIGITANSTEFGGIRATFSSENYLVGAGIGLSLSAGSGYHNGATFTSLETTFDSDTFLFISDSIYMGPEDVLAETEIYELTHNHTNQLSFDSGDIFFTTQTLDMEFIDLNTNSSVFRTAGETLKMNSNGNFSVSVTDALEWSTEGSLTMTSESLLVLAESVTMDSDASAEDSIFWVGKRLDIFSGNLTIESGKTAINSDFVDISVGDHFSSYSDFETKMTFADLVIETSDYLINSLDDAYLSSTNTQFASSGDISFISTVATVGDVHFKAENQMSVSAGIGNILYSSENLFVQAGGFLSFESTNITVATTDTLKFYSGGDIVVDAFNTTFEVLNTTAIDTENWTFESSDAHYWETCAGDISIRAASLSTSSTKNIFFKQGKVCDSDVADSYWISLAADDGALSAEATYVWFNATDVIDIKGGELGLFATYSGAATEFANLDIFSSQGISFNSIAGPAEVDHGARPDIVFAEEGNIKIEAATAVLMYASGANSNDLFEDFGILLETAADFNETDINVDVFNGKFNGLMKDGFTISTALALGRLEDGLPQDIQVRTPHDILFSSRVGGVDAYAGGVLDSVTEGVFDTAISFNAPIGDILFESHQAAIIVNGFTGVSLQSQQGQLQFDVEDDIFHRASVVDDSTIRYYAKSEDFNITAAEDISFGAGSDSSIADMLVKSFGPLPIISGQSQRYHQSGASTTVDMFAFEIISDYGDIRFDAHDELQFAAAGHAKFTAGVKSMQWNAGGDIIFDSDAGTVNIDINNDVIVGGSGFVDITAQGGGGDVSMTSDSNQDMIVDAAGDIITNAREITKFFATTGVEIVTEEGPFDISSGDDILFHSSARMIIESLGVRPSPRDGVYFLGESVTSDVLQDVIIESSFFTIGRVSAASEASDPLISISAGGDVATPGVIINSVGDVRHQTRKPDSFITFNGNKLDVDATSSMQFDTNGPIAFSTTSLFILDAFSGNMDIFGQEEVAFFGTEELVFKGDGWIDLSSSGRSGASGFNINGDGDLQVTAADQWTVTVENLADIDTRDVFVEAADLLTFSNTRGLEGSLSFVADSYLYFDSQGAMSFETEGDDAQIYVRTRGENSDLSISLDGGDAAQASIQSSDSVTVQGNHVDLDGRKSISFFVPNAGINIDASDDITVSANGTAAISSTKVFTVDAGVLLEASSSGNLFMEAENNIQLSATGDDEPELEFEADFDLFIGNFLNPTPSLRGNVRIEGDASVSLQTGSGDVGFRSGAEMDVDVDEDVVFSAGNLLEIRTTNPSVGGFRLLTNDDFNVIGDYAINVQAGTAGTGDVNIVVDDSVDFLLGTTGHDGLRLQAGNDLAIFAEDEVEFLSRYGIVMRSTDFLVFLSGEDIEVTSEDPAGDILFETVSGNLTFVTEGDVKMITNTLDADSTTGISTSENDGIILFEAESSIDITTDTMTMNGDHGVTMSAGGSLSVEAFSIDATANRGVRIISSGRDSPDKDGYGVLLEAGETLFFETFGAVHLVSEGGAVSMTASEHTFITAAEIAEFTASNQLRVTSGFDASPLSPFEDTLSHLFTAPDIYVTTSRNDIRVSGHNVEMNAPEITVATYSEDDGVLSARSERDIIVDAPDINIESFGNLRVQADEELSVASNTIDIQVPKDLTLQSNGDIEFRSREVGMTIEARSVTLDAPFSTVNFQETVNDVNNAGIVPMALRISPLPNEARLESPTYVQNPELPYEELHVPGCINRQFGVDFSSSDMCVCDRNKWRCVSSI